MKLVTGRRSAHLTEVRAILGFEITRLATLRATPENLKAIEAVVLAQEQELKSKSLAERPTWNFIAGVAEAVNAIRVLNIVVNRGQ